MAEPSSAPDYRTREMMVARLLELRPALEAWGVRHAFLLGSVARREVAADSDVDLILDLNPERHVGIFKFVGIRTFLTTELERDVDLGTRRSLVPGRHDRIIAELFEAF